MRRMRPVTIRELILITVIVAIAIGWWSDRARLKSQLGSKSQVMNNMSASIGALALVISFYGGEVSAHPDGSIDIKTKEGFGASDSDRFPRYLQKHMDEYFRSYQAQVVEKE